MDNIMNGDILDTIIQYASIYGIKIVGAVAIFVIGRWVASRLTRLLRSVMEKRNVDPTLVGFLGAIVQGLLLALIIIAALSNLGIETTSLAAVIAAAGLAVGLALQGSLSNFASGVMIIAFRPFRKGDYVEAGGTSGSVTEVGIFNTTLNTPDNKLVIVPNGNITSNTITNYSAHDTRRIDFVFGIGYDDDIKKAKQVLEDILKQDERVLDDPAPTIGVAELADSSVNIAVRPWVKTSDYWPVHFDITQAVKERFDEEGITIPFPQRDMNVRELPVAANTNTSKDKAA